MAGISTSGVNHCLRSRLSSSPVRRGSKPVPDMQRGWILATRARMMTAIVVSGTRGRARREDGLQQKRAALNNQAARMELSAGTGASAVVTLRRQPVRWRAAQRFRNAVALRLFRLRGCRLRFRLCLCGLCYRHRLRISGIHPFRASLFILPKRVGNRKNLAGFADFPVNVTTRVGNHLNHSKGCPWSHRR